MKAYIIFRPLMIVMCNIVLVVGTKFTDNFIIFTRTSMRYIVRLFSPLTAFRPITRSSHFTDTGCPTRMCVQSPVPMYKGMKASRTDYKIVYV